MSLLGFKKIIRRDGRKPKVGDRLYLYSGPEDKELPEDRRVDLCERRGDRDTPWWDLPRGGMHSADERHTLGPRLVRA